MSESKRDDDNEIARMTAALSPLRDHVVTLTTERDALRAALRECVDYCRRHAKDEALTADTLRECFDDLAVYAERRAKESEA